MNDFFNLENVYYGERSISLVKFHDVLRTAVTQLGFSEPGNFVKAARFVKKNPPFH